MKAVSDEQPPETVSRKRTKQSGDTCPEEWEWVERSVWTERMLEALGEGVKGGVWFSLMDKVFRPLTLEVAWKTVKRNGGGPGTDHQSIESFASRLPEEIARLSEELQAGTYRPRPIKRVHIEKPGSKEKRPLGIPCVRDRVVQAALRLVIEPIFEREFVSHSYGFRPGRGCTDALREVVRLLQEGYTHVVDADLKGYFDSIPHLSLMADMGRYIADGRVLGLLESFLKQDILEGLVQWTPERGSPQGAVISPLLANLYLHPVDVAMSSAGFEMLRYADDFIILCRTHEEAQRALDMLRQLAVKRGLSLHSEKTRLVDVSVPGEGFDFLGYHFEQSTRWPRKKSLKRLKDTVRLNTKRNNGHSLPCIIADVNRTLCGWFEYFKHSRKQTFPAIDQWVRRRLRSIQRRRLGYKGISRGLDHRRWTNKFFEDHGLFSLAKAHKTLLQSSVR